MGKQNTSSSSQDVNWQSTDLEYQNAIDLYKQFTGLRRQDMAFVTTAQVAILTIIGKRLLDMDFTSFLLSLVAFFIVLMGLNSERRFTAYMSGYMKRALQIESEKGISVLTIGANQTKNKKFLVSNTIVFPIYYLIFLLSWVIIWMYNLTHFFKL